MHPVALLIYVAAPALVEGCSCNKANNAQAERSRDPASRRVLKEAYYDELGLSYEGIPDNPGSFPPP